MSRTDKTDPYWGKAWNYGVLCHDHRSGECVISSYKWPQYKSIDGDCSYVIEGKYSYQASLAGPKSASEYCNLRERSARNSTRLALRNVILYEEFEDADVPDTKHRHSALWDMY